jgi:hypothetical protein
MRRITRILQCFLTKLLQYSSDSPHSRDSAVPAFRGPAALCVVLALACSSPTPDARDAPRNAAEDTRTAPPPIAWTVRPLVNAPRFFVLSGWTTNDTIWGLAGENPVDLHATSGAARAWGVRASGARRSPDGSALAWGDTSGIWMMRRGGRARRLVRYASLPQPPAGDPTNEILWAPNGRRLLTSWRDEGTVTHVLVDTLNGATEPIMTRLAGYGGATAVHWMDDRRILFATAAISAKDGTSGYRESGWRGDFAIHDVGTHTYDKVTDVPDGVFLAFAGAFGDTVVAVRRSAGDTLATFSLFDVASWTETRSGLTRGTGIAVSDDGQRAAVFRSDNTLSQVLIRAREAGAPAVAPVLIPGRITGAAWSPDGRALAVSTIAEERIEGTAADLRTVYRLSVIEAP